MFKCDTCGCNSQPGTKVSMRTVETRAREYPERGQYNEEGDWVIIDRGGFGHEIVKEIKECSNCAPRKANVVLPVAETEKSVSV